MKSNNTYILKNTFGSTFIYFKKVHNVTNVRFIQNKIKKTN